MHCHDKRFRMASFRPRSMDCVTENISIPEADPFILLRYLTRRVRKGSATDRFEMQKIKLELFFQNIERIAMRTGGDKSLYSRIDRSVLT